MNVRKGFCPAKQCGCEKCACGRNCSDCGYQDSCGPNMIEIPTEVLLTSGMHTCYRCENACSSDCNSIKEVCEGQGHRWTKCGHSDCSLGTCEDPCQGCTVRESDCQGPYDNWTECDSCPGFGTCSRGSDPCQNLVSEEDAHCGCNYKWQNAQNSQCPNMGSCTKKCPRSNTGTYKDYNVDISCDDCLLGEQIECDEECCKCSGGCVGNRRGRCNPGIHDGDTICHTNCTSEHVRDCDTYCGTGNWYEIN
jgi:hypothetical protein